MPGRRERKVVTVLFADLAGFTSRAESMDPEDVAALLDPYHARLKSELERFGGTVEKFIGDAVMAIFGAPVAHEDDAERAVRAALAIRDWAADEGIELRVGVNTGEALITLGAEPAAGQTMAAGDVVNTAARLQSAAPVGGILVGEQTFRATERVIEFAEREPVEAKGKTEPLAVWEALSARSRVGVERVHGAKLVGRTRELELLSGALDRARQERSPELVTLMGVPGIGKSRLVLELYERIEQEQEITSWRHGRCLPYGDGVTFWALGEMVKAHAGILEGEDASEAARKLSAVVDDPWIESHLRPLVGLSADGGGEDRRDEAFTAWRRFFEGIADERPLVLAFEDLHWADDNLLDFVDHLVDWATGVPILLVCTARPELMTRRPGWGGGKPNALTISLSPLGDEETARLIGELLERSVLEADTQRDLLARAGGNPLYAEEYARVLRERGELHELPETVQGMIAARLDLLEPAQKALVQDAAVVGKSFWLGALASLTEADPRTLETELHLLERKEFVRRERSSAVAGEVEYTFRHLLVRDVAYGQIPRAERAQKHQRAAEWLEGLGRAEDRSEMLAHHYLQALELGAAAGLDPQEFAPRAEAALADAGDRAFALHAYEAAARFYGAAADLLPAGDPRHGRLLLGRGRALWVAGEPQAELVETARDELLAAGDTEGAAEAEIRLAEHFWLAGDRETSTRHLDHALELVAPLATSPVKARATANASRFRMLAGDSEAAIDLGTEALAMAEELGLDEVRAAALDNVGAARAALGDERGRSEIAEAIRIAESANVPFELCRAKGNLAAHTFPRGSLEEALELWEASGRDAERFGQVGFHRWTDGVVLQPLYQLGRWEEALARSEAFIADVEGGLPHYLAHAAYSIRGLLRLARNDDEGASADAETALMLGLRAADPQAYLPVQAIRAHVLCELGPAEETAALLDEYIAAARRGAVGLMVSMLHIVAFTAVTLGRGGELAEAPVREDYPWARAAHAIAIGDSIAAAEIFRAMGSVAEEAFARLYAARSLVARGARSEADPQLQRALDFYRSVGATRYVREAESLLTATA